MTASHPSKSPSSVPTLSPAPNLRQALLPVIILIELIYLCVVQFDSSAHLALVFSTAVAGLVAWSIGHPWKDLELGLVEGISVGLKAILILLVVGMLIATWIIAGIVPVMIYYGLQLLNPSIFLVATCLICCVISISTGSSWTTAGTVGVALIGVGQGFGVPLGMVAGAVISGAYFGDKLSPLSDTTNLAPAVAGSELFEHVRYMMLTTMPALVIALVLYLILGFNLETQAGAAASVASIQSTISANYNLNLLLLLPPVLVVVMVVMRLPALPALLGGVVIGGIMALLFQEEVTLGQLFTVAFGGFESATGMEAVDELLTNGGLMNMMETVALVICALGFGGVMERSGMLGVLAGSVVRLAHHTGSLVTATVFTCFGMNVIAPDQYLSVVVPGRMYRDTYERQGLEPRLLSRTLEDAGTLSSPLIAWNTCGAFMSETLNVSPLHYAPYAFLNLLTPLVAIVIAFSGWKIVKVSNLQSPISKGAT